MSISLRRIDQLWMDWKERSLKKLGAQTSVMDMAHHFQTLHNLRVLVKNGSSRGAVYRSARQEKLSHDDAKVTIYTNNLN